MLAAAVFQGESGYRFSNQVQQEGIEIAFVNERISAEDAKKYGIAEINKDFIFGPDAVRLWTIDRDKNVYLRRMKNDREEPTEHEVSFFWKGALFHIDFKVTGGVEKTAEGWKGRTHWSWNGMRRPKNPDDQTILDEHRQEILTDLKEALAAYKDIGVFSKMVEHSATFDFLGDGHDDIIRSSRHRPAAQRSSEMCNPRSPAQSGRASCHRVSRTGDRAL